MRAAKTHSPEDHRGRRRLGVIQLVAVGCLLVAACSAESGDTTTSTVDTTTTTSPTPTTLPPSDTNDLASGSGCKPGTEAGLPDGEWYGYIVDLDATTVEFDLACWFTGDAAIAAADEDGAESPPPNDYYIRNENETVRPLTVGDSAQVEYLANNGDPDSATTEGYEDWYVEWEISEFVPGYWITVEDGEVTSIVQQYVP